MTVEVGKNPATTVIYEDPPKEALADALKILGKAYKG